MFSSEVKIISVNCKHIGAPLFLTNPSNTDHFRSRVKNQNNLARISERRTAKDKLNCRLTKHSAHITITLQIIKSVRKNA
jgi:hypothetical protein